MPTLNWKKVDIDTTKDYIVLMQNSSVIPSSVVHISMTTAQAPTGPSFLLTGPNTWSGRIKAGTNVFFAETGGGIFTHTLYPVEPLVNYSIPTVHTDIKARNEVLNIPEGAYFVIQNKDKKPFYFSVVGEGTFVLVEHQMLSFTFTKDTQVKLRGDNQQISYFYSESPSLTKLSAETQAMIEDMKAKVELLTQQTITRDELLAISKRTYYDKYSPFVAIQEISFIPTGSPTFDIIGPLFELDETFASSFEPTNDVVNLIIELSYSHNGNTKISTFGLTMDFETGVVAKDPVEYTNYDDVIDKLLKEIRLEYSNNGVIRPIVSLNTWYQNVSAAYEPAPEVFFGPVNARFKIRSSNAVWKQSFKTFTPNHASSVLFDSFPNKGLTWITDKYYKNMIQMFKVAEASVVKRTTFDDTLSFNSTSNSYTIVSSSNNLQIDASFTETSAKMILQVDKTLIPENSKISNIMFIDLDNSTRSVNINVDICASFTEDRSSQIVGNKLLFDIDLHIPTMFGVDFYKSKFELIKKSIATDKYIIQLTTTGGE